MNKIIKVLKNPLLLILHMCQHWPFRYISDKTFLKLYFRTYQGYKLNIEEPKTFNEKIQWLKINDKNEKYTELTDKYLVRNYIKEKIGEKYLIPLLGTWNNAKDINFDKLPNQFVLKCNHDSASVIICKDKEKFNKKKAIRKLNKALKYQYFWKSREYNYKNIEPKIIAEKYMVDQKSEELVDYKFFCFNGEPKFIQVDIGRFTKHIRNYYDIDGSFIPVEYGCPNDEKIAINEDINLNEMIRLAKILSKDLIMVRVDLYQVKGKIYFGEMTFHHGGGSMQVKPFKYDEEWGKYIDLNDKKGNGKIEK